MTNVEIFPSETDPPSQPRKLGAPLGNQSNLKWTPEQDAALKKLRAENYSSSQAAVAINDEFNTRYTRNAVIGRAKRLGLCGTQIKSGPKVFKLRSESKARTRPTPPRSEPEVIKLRCVEIVPLHIGLLALDDTRCRYPYGDGPSFTFCGHPPTAGSPYCMPHFSLCLGSGTTSERSSHRGIE